MTEKQVRQIKKSLSTKNGSPLLKLFYTGRHYTIRKDKVPFYSNDMIKDELKIPNDDSINSFEYDGIDDLLFKSMYAIRKSAKQRGQPWVDATIQSSTTKRSIASHGFTNDINKALACIDEYEKRKNGARENFRLTRDNLVGRFPRLNEVIEKRKLA